MPPIDRHSTYRAARAQARRGLWALAAAALVLAMQAPVAQARPLRSDLLVLVKALRDCPQDDAVCVRAARDRLQAFPQPTADERDVIKEMSAWADMMLGTQDTFDRFNAKMAAMQRCGNALPCIETGIRDLQSIADAPSLDSEQRASLTQGIVQWRDFAQQLRHTETLNTALQELETCNDIACANAAMRRIRAVPRGNPGLDPALDDAERYFEQWRVGQDQFSGPHQQGLCLDHQLQRRAAGYTLSARNDCTVPVNVSICARPQADSVAEDIRSQRVPVAATVSFEYDDATANSGFTYWITICDASDDAPAVACPASCQ